MTSLGALLTTALLVGVISDQALFLLTVALAPYAFNPWLMHVVGTSAVPIVIPLLGLCVAGRWMLRGPMTLFPRVLLPAAAFVGLALASIGYAGNPMEAALSVERAALRVLLFPYLAWLLVRFRPSGSQERIIQRTLAVTIAAALVGGFIALVQFGWKGAYWLPEAGAFLTYRRDYMLRPIALTESPTAWGIFLILPMFIALSRVAERFTPGRLLLFGFFILSLAMSGTRSAWVGALGGLIWLFTVRWRLRWNTLRGVLGLLGIGAVVILTLPAAQDTVTARIAVRGEGIVIRRAILGAGLQMVARHPLTGVGAGNFASYVVEHPEIVGESTLVVSEEGFQSHNTLLGIWAEVGLFGLAAILWLLITIWNVFSRVAAALRRIDSPIHPVLVDGLQATFLGFVIASFGQRVDEYLFIWLVPALALMLAAYARRVAPASSALSRAS